MPWHSIRSFRDSDYTAIMRDCEMHTQTFFFRRSTTREITPQMRRQVQWYVAGWKIHLSIYPAEYARVLPSLQLFENRMASTGLVYKYAASKRHYENFSGLVKGKFATLYCKSAEDIPPIIQLVNQIFTQDGITPVSKKIIGTAKGLRHELPLIGGYGFVRYGAFCYTRQILDLTDPQHEPFEDDRYHPYPQFRNPSLLDGEIGRFKNVIDSSQTNA
ncbi:hypothetical protein [Desulfosarcina ovata]|uniref:Uncharacterized protein n=2 Tax=Desulfosarcina ovata TaxID=83564 RepID=A0A5K8AGN7_9BACT|nr:hypothetical protein [Desulfosarcina ovata]BBO84541.1 hypothetical protein DSCO28_51070 [Desulfosarcina ovata subsp. sediminis]BBO91014.1 hypothetical protein DSCOOX_41940 [Desulfosarcina ovata subsp. ovata]